MCNPGLALCFESLSQVIGGISSITASTGPCELGDAELATNLCQVIASKSTGTWEASSFPLHLSR